MKNLYLLIFALLFSSLPSAAIAPITGATSVCAGDSILLSDTTAGGVWSCISSVVSVNGATGMVTGINAGTAAVSYVVAGNFEEIIVTVNPLPGSGTISGPASLCLGDTATIASTDTGGTWSTGNGNITISAGGLVTAIASGMDTVVYTVTNSCGVASSSFIVTINTLPDAGAITGTATVCESSETVLGVSAAGGTWSSSSSNAAVLAGTVTGITAGTATISYTTTNSCGSSYTTTGVTINPFPHAGVLSGITTVCEGAITTLASSSGGGVWSASNGNVAVSDSAITGIAAGTATISYIVTNGCGVSIATINVTVDPLPVAGIISGIATVCEGAATVLTSSASGGAWSSSGGSASVSGGTVTGIAAGIETISYTAANSCGSVSVTADVTVNPNPDAGTVSGTTTLCQSATAVLTSTATGGAWSSSNGNASVAGGTVTGITSGSSIISYTVANSCGTSVATTEVTISPLPDAGTLSGSASVCAGTSVVLTSTATGGAWTASNANAGVTGGTVSGITTGTDNISYSVSNSCGTAVSTFAMTVNTSPSVGAVTGPFTVCQAAAITLTDLTSGGAWTASNGNATVSAGIVTGVSPGPVVISYTITNGCGTAITTKNVTVNPLPDPGTISGPASVCPGSTITYSSTGTGGFWHVSNANATVSASGVITGITAGPDIISYSFINACGTASAVAVVIVSSLPDAGTITGTPAMCVSSSSVFTPSVAGGLWSASNPDASITPATGLVHSAIAGIDTISYTVTNSCGATTATQVITINPLPVAGSISGPSAVCEAATITLTSSLSGGVWNASNTRASVSAGAVTGVSAGVDTIIYSMTNTCGTATITHAVSVNPLPSAGSVTGATVVCPAATIALTDAAGGGTWGTTGTHVTVSATGVVTGVSPGTATISYTVSNTCGTEGTSNDVTVNPLPGAGSVSGGGSVCAGTSISLSDPNPGGVWSASNGDIAITAGGICSGVNAGTVNVSYTVTNSCGADAATTTVTVLPHPDAGSITGTDTLCTGQTTEFTDTAHGGVWSYSNANIAGTDGVITGQHAGTAAISYTVTNLCGTVSSLFYVVVEPCTTGISAIPANTELQVFPNPATEQLNITMGAGIYRSLAITNSIGETVIQQPVSSAETSVDIRSLSPGVYYLKLAGNNGMAVRKFVKL